MESRSVVRAAVFDALAIVVFVVLGRRSHDEGSAIGGVISTAAPFLIAAVVTWVAARLPWKDPLDPWTAGVPVWIGTVALGMVLRNLVFGDGTALSFVIVATTFLGAFLVGWRLVAQRVGEGRGLTTAVHRADPAARGTRSRATGGPAACAPNRAPDRRRRIRG
ncbi:MAG: DUF3054 domain-containing protein [Ilumatobacteraceae bacterium]